MGPAARAGVRSTRRRRATWSPRPPPTRALPLLQFTLTELYDRRVDGHIVAGALEAIGGMAGAIGRRAENGLPRRAGQGHADARELFARLVTPGRRLARHPPSGVARELSPGMPEVAAAFVAARLLVTDVSRRPVNRPSRSPTRRCLARWSRLRRGSMMIADGSPSCSTSRLRPRVGRRRPRRRRAVPGAGWSRRSRPSTSTRDRVRSRASFVDAGRAARDADIVEARRSARRLRRRLTAVAIALVAASPAA